MKNINHCVSFSDDYQYDGGSINTATPGLEDSTDKDREQSDA